MELRGEEGQEPEAVTVALPFESISDALMVMEPITGVDWQLRLKVKSTVYGALPGWRSTALTVKV
jgi:hypothetical protein